MPRREDVYGALFWPDTWFVDMSAYPEAVQQFDGDVTQLFERGDLGILVAAAARMHEQMHWLQSVGTSYGRFLALNRIISGDLADAILTTATPAELELLAAARRRGQSPATRDRNGHLTHSLGYSTTLQSLFDHWWSTLVVEHFLNHGTTSLLGPVDPRFMVGLSLRYGVAGDALRDVFNSPDEGFMETTRAFGPDDEQRTPTLRSGLTAAHLEEAAAMVVQHVFNSRVAAALPHDRYVTYAKNAVAWTLERFFDDRHSLYTKAFCYFADRAPEMDEWRHLELFLLVVDIALNPRIPDDGSPLGAAWGDFHPVLRFERLVEALNGFSPDTATADGAPPASWWRSERARLVSRAGVSDASSHRCFARQLAPEANPLSGPTSFLRRFIGMAAANLDSLKENFPAAGVSPVHATDGDEDAFIKAVDAFDGPAYDPPLIIKAGGLGEPSSISDRLYVEALTALTFRRATHSWLVRPGSLNFSGLPSDKAGRMIQQSAIDRLQTLYGMPLD
jgi:hypothetical protein